MGQTPETDSAAPAASTLLDATDVFLPRHIGPSDAQVGQMLRAIGVDSLDALTRQAVPADIRLDAPPDIGEPRSESEAIADLAAMAGKNVLMKSFIGMGYHGTLTPAVIQRNVLENPGWYTQYTPYQAEISQGRLEALLNFQTLVSDLTALPLANASLLDEATAAAEAMAMALAIAPDRRTFLVGSNCHPQTIAVVRTRAKFLGCRVELFDPDDPPADLSPAAGILLQYPGTDGRIIDPASLAARAKSAGAVVVFAADLLALTLLRPPGEMDADIAVGSTQRFGVPMGFGGPHAAYMATRTEHARRMPGRLVGVSRDAQNLPALRLTLQTREQHIRRERATSNICTAQVLLAIMAGMYAVYHGPDGLVRIARRIHGLTRALQQGLLRIGHDPGHRPCFDTLKVRLNGLPASAVLASAVSRGINLRDYGDGEHVGVSLDETATRQDVEAVLESFSGGSTFRLHLDELAGAAESDLPARGSAFLTHPVFHRHHSETAMLRYIHSLQSKDLSLAQSMIPLGSCTMKLNATSEMLPVTWPAFASMHPYVPRDQSVGYRQMLQDLERRLAGITGMAAVSLQPNAGSQGEYAGLLAIRRYHESRSEGGRDVCLIPTSAHGTNPASAAVAGLKVVAVACRPDGDIDLGDLASKARSHRDALACAMFTYPSTHGVFEPGIASACRIVHEHGGQVYMDGANMNAQVGVCRPGDIGADVCHLNLHKTFCIPHGGGGPGMGPIAVASHLSPFLPGDPLDPSAETAPVSAAPFGSASILPISWMYIAMTGSAGLRKATQVAILNANYMAHRLEPHYPVLFRGPGGRVAHEFILDLRPLQQTSGVTVEDVAKRLMDYGFHAPTMSWPVAGTLMIEPTESEPMEEMDRFCDAMIAIRGEVYRIERGELDRTDNPLKHAPHPVHVVSSDAWPHAYSRQLAAYPAPWLNEQKFWPSVSRIDNPYGDRNLVCTCPPMGDMP